MSRTIDYLLFRSQQEAAEAQARGEPSDAILKRRELAVRYQALALAAMRPASSSH
jgi:hypothetical protein